MYNVGYVLGKLFKYKWYVLLTILYFYVMGKVEKWLDFDLSLSFFFMVLYAWWLFMEIRAKKSGDDPFFTATVKYIKWYIQNFRFFLKGER